MPSLVQTLKIKTLPEKKVIVYDHNEKEIDNFGVVFKALKKKEIDSIIGKITDDDVEYGITDALNCVVSNYSGWTDLPSTLEQVSDTELKNELKMHFNISDEKQALNQEQITYMINVGMQSQYADAVWITFLDVNNTQASVFAERNRRKSNKRR